MANQTVDSFNSTKGLIRILELSEPFEFIELQFIPRELNNSKAGKYNSIENVNNNADQFQLKGATETISFEAEFKSLDRTQDVISKGDWLKSLMMHPKRNVVLDFGGMFEDYIFVFTSLDIIYSRFVNGNAFSPQRFVASITLTVETNANLTFERVRNGTN